MYVVKNYKNLPIAKVELIGKRVSIKYEFAGEVKEECFLIEKLSHSLEKNYVQIHGTFSPWVNHSTSILIGSKKVKALYNHSGSETTVADMLDIISLEIH